MPFSPQEPTASKGSAILSLHSAPPNSLGRQTRLLSNSSKPQPPPNAIDIKALLSTPSWSVSSLLPPTSAIPADFPVTPEKLRHLLRLSALPPPKDAAEEAEMMQTLASQLHFVREIQKVDTTGVEPLRAIRDETAEAAREAEITIESLNEAFEKEEVLGSTIRGFVGGRRRLSIPRPRRIGVRWNMRNEVWGNTLSLTETKFWIRNEESQMRAY